MTVMSEGLLLNSKYIKMGREEGFFKLSSHNQFQFVATKYCFLIYSERIPVSFS